MNIDDAIEALESEDRRHRRYLRDADDDEAKRYWRTFSAGILHSLNTLRRMKREHEIAEEVRGE